jgi:hypothetical protein
MPNRTILNKYGLFVSQIHKVLKKKWAGDEDLRVINMARLIAALSSNHSWRTYRYLHDNDSFDKDAIRVEMSAAYREGWRDINENDIKEVLTAPIDEHAFSMVLTCWPEKDERHEFKELFKELQKEFIDGIEPLETRETA